MQTTTEPVTKLGQPSCGSYRMPPLRPELQAAYDEMDAKRDYFAYAVCRAYDGLAWEVNVRKGNICSAISSDHADHAVAMAVGEVWLLEQLARKPDADELALRQLWAKATLRR